MAELTIEVTGDKSLPTHALFITVQPENAMRITCSPSVETQALAVLRRDIGLAVADAIENRGAS